MMTEEQRWKILEETGGDCDYGDVFLEAAVEAAASRGVKIEEYLMKFFYKEVERHRVRRERRVREN
jgi:hypothetical protein